MSADEEDAVSSEDSSDSATSSSERTEGTSLSADSEDSEEFYGTSESAEATSEETESSETSGEADTVSTITFAIHFYDNSSANLNTGTRIKYSEHCPASLPVDLDETRTDSNSEITTSFEIRDLTDIWDANCTVEFTGLYIDSFGTRVHFISLTDALEAAGLIADAHDYDAASEYLIDNAGATLSFDVTFPN